MQKEKDLHNAFAKWMKYQYPDVIFTSDASGLRVSVGLRTQLKAQRSNHKIPDVIILHPRGKYHGLILELKVSGIYRQNGNFVSDHVREQAETLLKLNELGYMALFAVGLDKAMEIVNTYMANKIKF